VAVTKRELTRYTIFSRAAVKEDIVGHRRHLLADRSDFVAGSIFLFENRDPEGDLLEVDAPEMSATEQSARFTDKFGPRLRRLFHDLRDEELASEEDLPLFYWPQTSDARIRLALRLRELARIVRYDD
jgi:hypothetical protein